MRDFRKKGVHFKLGLNKDFRKSGLFHYIGLDKVFQKKAFNFKEVALCSA